MVTVGKLG